MLESVAAERVSLSKIASGPCVPHRSFHRAYRILGDPGADSGGEGKSKQAGKYGTKEK